MRSSFPSRKMGSMASAMGDGSPRACRSVIGGGPSVDHCALSYAERLPMLYSKALFLALSGMHLSQVERKTRHSNLTTILHHFVGVRGEKVTPVDFGRATA